MINPFLIVLAFICEIIDSGIGMGYGTILSPLLIILGFNPTVVVPSLILSQTIGGFIASCGHHRIGNAKVWQWKSKDFLVGVLISGLGIFAAVVSSIIAISVSKQFVQTYIGVMVLVIGILLLIGITFSWSWFKVSLLGIISAFNKGISGGGFGPLITSGQIVIGEQHRAAIGITTFAEAPICLTSFITYLIFKGTPILVNPILLSLCIGASLGGLVGIYLTKSIPKKHARPIVGMLVTFLGLFALLKGEKI